MTPAVKKLTSKYNTRDPFEIAKCLGYIIIHTPLVGVRGFYQHVKRSHIIYIDDSLDEAQEKFVCGHELGHSLLHKDINRIFMDTRTLAVSSKYEIEADHFAVDLIHTDEDFIELLDFTIPQIAQCLNLSESLVEYRISTLK